MEGSLINSTAENNSWISNSKYFFMQLKPFKDNELWINHWDTVLKNCASLWTKKISFIIYWNNNNIKFFVKIPKEFETFFKNTFYANFSTSDLEPTEINPECDSKWNILNKKFLNFEPDSVLYDKDYFIKDGTYMDPMRDILALFGNIPATENLMISFKYCYKEEVSFAQKLWKSALKVIKTIRWSDEKKTEEVKDDKKSLKILCSISYALESNDEFSIKSVDSNFKAVFTQFWWKFKIKTTQKFHNMNIDQVVNFFHIPTKANFVKWLEYTVYKKLPYPTNLPTVKNTPEWELTILWKTHYRWEAIEFWIKREDKFRHYYIIWKTWTWKSTFISNMVKSDVEAWNWLCLLDPHWDLVDTVLEHIPTSRINDVILFDVSDTDYPIWFNLLQADNEDEKNRIASGVVSTFQKLFENSRWPRLEYILRNVVLTVINYPNATLMHITRILTDKDFRTEVLSTLDDAVLKKFWESEFNKRWDKQRDEAIAPIVNKIWQFLSSKLVRNIFGQPRSKLNMRKAMDEWKIILVNLSKWKIWEDNAAMIWSLLVTKIQIDAMSRADIAREERRDFYLYIDEFQNFATKAFATILSEARKYRLSLIVANQFTSQIQDEVKEAIFGNVWTIMAFTLWKDDAEIISWQFKWLVSPNDLISLPMFTSYIKLMANGISWDPFSMRTNPLPTPEWSLELIDKIRKQSRQRYAMERWELESLMEAWNNKTFSVQEKIQEKAKLEWLGISEQEYEDSQDLLIQSKIHLFKDCKINWIEPDAIVFDTKNNRHKICWYRKPNSFGEDINIKFKKGQILKTLMWDRLEMYIDIYDSNHKMPYQIWIWKKENIYKQLKEAYKNNPFIKFIPNISLLSETAENTDTKKVQNWNWWSNNTWNNNWSHNWKPWNKKWWNNHGTQNNKWWINGNNLSKNSNWFNIDNIKLWERYDWYIKLQYNYGMFITVKWVEWLLHKNVIKAPEWVEWKKYYNIWDKIKVRASEFKEINWEKRVVRSQI